MHEVFCRLNFVFAQKVRSVTFDVLSQRKLKAVASHHPATKGVPWAIYPF
jgi:hypothetical protein